MNEREEVRKMKRSEEKNKNEWKKLMTRINNNENQQWEWTRKIDDKNQ